MMHCLAKQCVLSRASRVYFDQPAVRYRHGGLSGSPSLAHKFAKFGHAARLTAPLFVAATHRMGGKRGKNDAADTTAWCEAIQHQT